MSANDRNVLVTLRFFDDESMAILTDAGCTVTIHEPPQGANDGAFSPDQLKEMLAGKQGWVVGHAWVTREVLEAAPELAVVARRGVGYERVDVGGRQGARQGRHHRGGGQCALRRRPGHRPDDRRRPPLPRAARAHGSSATGPYSSAPSSIAARSG